MSCASTGTCWMACARPGARRAASIGSRTSEFTNATTTQCFDSRSGRWAVDLLERLGVPPHVLPEVVQPGTRLAPLSGDVAAETGLGAVQVVAVATHDTGSAVAAVPF